MSSATFHTITMASKSKPTSVKVIDSYYKTLNNLDEVDRLRYLNDFKRLKDQIISVWNTNPIITKVERSFILKFIEAEAHTFSPILL